MRLDQPQTCCDIIGTFKEQKIINKKPIAMQSVFSKQQLWHIFLYEFRQMYGVDFIESEENINNVKPLFLYFLKDEEFFKCSNLVSDLSKPSFEKGLMIVGGYGIGKTAYFKVFEKIFKTYLALRFTGFSAKELVVNYEECKASDKSYMLKQIARPKLLIDDINSERIASNYGKCDVIGEILFIQNEKNYKTFVTCNHTNPENNIEQTLIDLGKRYDGRLLDRFFKMFNIIGFTGKSKRR